MPLYRAARYKSRTFFPVCLVTVLTRRLTKPRGAAQLPKDKALDKAKDLLGDPFDPGAACQALAQCETTVNGNNVGKHASYNGYRQ